MKGLNIIRAEPANAIDIYPLLEMASKEGVFLDAPSVRELKNYYFGSLLKELSTPYHLWLLARRGRGYLGFAHALVVPRRWDGAPTTLLIDTVFVTDKRRKNGIGAKLIDELVKSAENMGIKQIEFICPDSQVDLWAKKRKAVKLSNVMRVEL